MINDINNLFIFWGIGCFLVGCIIGFLIKQFLSGFKRDDKDDQM